MNKDIYFHNITEKNAIKHLESSTFGLTKEEAAHRLTIYGPNQLQSKKKTSLTKLFISQFKDFMIIILIIAAIISFAVSVSTKS